MTSQTFSAITNDPQAPFDVAVVIPTILRPHLERAVASVFAQKGASRIQILIGIDKAIGPGDVIDNLKLQCPDTCAITVIDLGYSTSKRHGGQHGAHDGGALRSILTLAANSRYVAYLDDDNWWADNHLASLLDAIETNVWAYGLRWYTNPITEKPICIDEWESTGLDTGLYRDRFGGFVDPSSLLIDKTACLPILHKWCTPIETERSPMTADRNFFDALRPLPAGKTDKATTYYVLEEADADGTKRKRIIEKQLQSESSRKEKMAAGFGEESIYDAQFDRSVYSGTTRDYILCCTPRVGSWLLCDLLEGSNAMGVPAEYFNLGVGLMEMARRFGLNIGNDVPVLPYTRMLKKHRTTNNGIFGIKLHYWMMEPLLENEIIASQFSNATYIYVQRHDLLAQAVSHDIAKSTDQWTTDNHNMAIPYDTTRILDSVKFIQSERQSWEYYFATTGITPLRVYYEDIVADTETVCKAICDHIGIETQYRFSLNNARMQKQNNERNQEWIKRFRQEIRNE